MAEIDLRSIKSIWIEETRLKESGYRLLGKEASGLVGTSRALDGGKNRVGGRDRYSRNVAGAPKGVPFQGVEEPTNRLPVRPDANWRWQGVDEGLLAAVSADHLGLLGVGAVIGHLVPLDGIEGATGRAVTCLWVTRSNRVEGGPLARRGDP